MMRKIIFIVALLALPWNMAAAQKMYKWIDSRGNVSYHDRPPPPGSEYRVEERSVRGKQDKAGDATDEAAQKAPVILYSIPKCPSCDSVRAYLQKRKVPFTEKVVDKDVKLQEELRAKSGTFSVPTILVGTKVMNGYLESLLAGELDQAGYPAAESDKAAEKPAEEGFKAPTQ